MGRPYFLAKIAFSSVRLSALSDRFSIGNIKEVCIGLKREARPLNLFAQV